MNVLGCLAYGRNGARTKQHIAAQLGVPTRSVEAEIEALRKSGKAAICSDSQVGYWRPLTAAEYAENVARRRRRALGQLLTVRGERKALRAMETIDQPTLGLVA